jgi:hypothetical protein
VNSEIVTSVKSISNVPIGCIRSDATLGDTPKTTLSSKMIIEAFCGLTAHPMLNFEFNFRLYFNT